LELLPPRDALETIEHTPFGPGLRTVAGGAPQWMTGDMSYGLLPRWGARHWFLPAAEDLDDTHGATATGARLAQGEWDDLGLWLWLCDPFRFLDAE